MFIVQVLTPADEIHHINKHNFKVPFVCGCRDLGEALRRIAEGAAMIRTKVGYSYTMQTTHVQQETAMQVFSPDAVWVVQFYLVGSVVGSVVRLRIHRVA